MAMQQAPLTPDCARPLPHPIVRRRRPVSPLPSDQALSSVRSLGSSTNSGASRRVTFSESLDVALPPPPAVGQCIALWGYPKDDARNGVTASVVSHGENPLEVIIRADNSRKEFAVEISHIRIVDQLCFVLVHTPEGQRRVSIRASMPVGQLLRTRALQNQSEGAVLRWNGRDVDLKASPEQYDWPFAMETPVELHLCHPRGDADAAAPQQRTPPQRVIRAVREAGRTICGKRS